MVGSGKEKNWAGKGMGNLGPGAGGRLQVSKEYMLRSGHIYKDLWGGTGGSTVDNGERADRGNS